MKIFTRLLVVGIVAVSVPVCMLVGVHASFPIRHVAPVGTYQVISAKPRFSESHMDSLRYLIETKRDKEKEVLLDVSEQVKVRILPEKEIHRQNFKPVDEFVFVERNVKHISNSK